MVKINKAITSWKNKRKFRKAKNPRKLPHWHPVRELLVAHFTYLDKKARRRAIDELTDRVVMLEPWPDGLQGTKKEQMKALALRILQTLRWIKEDRNHLKKQFDQFTLLYDNASTEAHRKRLLIDWLADNATDKKHYKDDLNSLDRWLDLETLRERQSIEQHKLTVLIELGLIFLTQMKHYDLGPIPQIGQFALDRFERETYWRVKTRAAETVLAWADDIDPSHAYELALETAIDPNSHPWLIESALSLIFLFHEDDARSICESIIARGDHEGLQEKEFLAKGLAARSLLKHASPNSIASYLTTWKVSPPDSVFVQQKILESLPYTTEGRSLINAWLIAVNIHPKVKATAYQAWERQYRETPESVDFSVLLTSISAEQSPVALHAACDLFGVLITTVPLHSPFLGELSNALDQLQSRDNTTPAVAEHAAARLRELTSRYKYDASDDALSDFFTQLPRGKVQKFSWDQVPSLNKNKIKDARFLGSLLARHSRADWGLQAQITEDHLYILRGDRYKRTFWRILHEMRSPAPDKRTGVKHTTGRVPFGDIRAPALLLHEATETTVPGERVRIEQEGDWARHLPLVEDILYLPLFNPKPIQLFSSYGVTVITPPTQFSIRLKNRLKLGFKFASIASLRNESLRASGPERSAYTRLLSEKYDVSVDFIPLDNPGEEHVTHNTHHFAESLFKVKAS